MKALEYWGFSDITIKQQFHEESTRLTFHVLADGKHMLIKGLPEEKKEVLISADGDLYIAEYETNHGRGYWSEVVEYRNVTDVDAWMPLPKQYGGEQE